MDDLPAAKRTRRSRNTDPVETYNFRKVSGAKCSDYFCSLITMVTRRPYANPRHVWTVPPDPSYSKEIPPAQCLPQNPMTALCTQWINTVYNYDAKQREGGGPVRRSQFAQMLWTPGGRRLVAATTQGDFVLWNGHSYNIESRTIAHEDTPCRVLALAPVNDLIFSGDDKGVLKMWQQNLNCVRRLEAHTSGGNAIRDIAIAPSEAKFVTAGKDGTARVWDTDSQHLESRLEGHGSDVCTASWHPTMSLVATGSLDRDVRLWDPRASAPHVGTIQGHSNGVSRIRFNPTDPNWLLSAGKDNTIRLWDLRTLTQSALYHGHTKEVSSIDWHPQHSSLFASGGLDGTIAYWIVGYGDATLHKEGRDTVNKWVAAVPKSHGEFRTNPNPVLDVKWHPLGHVVASSSWDGRLWTRNKPGTEMEVAYNETLDTNYDVAVTAEKARQLARAAASGNWDPTASKGGATPNSGAHGSAGASAGGAGNLFVSFE